MEEHPFNNSGEAFKDSGGGPGRRSKLKTFMIVFLSCLIILALAAGSAVFYAWNGLQPVSASDQPVRIAIPTGTSTNEIAAKLEEQGMIKNSTLFVYYLRYQKQGSRFQAGEYEMKPGMTLDEIIEKLNEGETVKEEVVRFTIPEGFTVRQIAERLGEQGLVDAEGFLKMTNEKHTLPNNWVADIPDQPDIAYRLEGYLFPETYEMKKGSTAEDILKRLVSEWDRKLNELPSGWPDQMKQRGLTFHQLLTIASLIEREVVLEQERPVVAGVIYNRLDKKMPLQIDATVQYALGKPKERLLEKDLFVESPYNTYAHDGLPPGPIASPSLSSVKAALYPEKTNYLFYVTKKDGSQGHLFAETFDEHKKNIERSKKNQ
ncbi:endolytic transglycosylase MltG [Paenibacillus sp. MBLB4367]|uniref:endolytic transglycosylase MltG n=1 Tax=Paenibacillus sp. MBLB4367 TaxID=3384767 RepID=UPI0039081355